MPTYQYVCTNPEGRHEFELVQSFTEAPASECPVCGSPVRKVYGSVGVVFKGSGFYRTDSRAGANGSSKNGDTSANVSDSPSSKEPTSTSTPKKESASSSSATSSTSSTTSGSKAAG